MARANRKLLRVAHNFSGPTAVADSIAAAQAFARATGMDDDSASRLAIIVEELVANIFEHSGLGPEESVELSLARLGSEISLTLEDRGHAFDPRNPPVPEAFPPERGGGAGLGLINAWTRILSYESAGAVNRLELVIPLDGEDLPPAA